MFALQPARARKAHIFVAIVLALAAVAATIVLPSGRATAAPAGTSAEIAELACGRDARIVITNLSDVPRRFDLWRHGQRAPFAMIELAPDVATTVSHSLSETTQRFVVRIDGATLDDEVVSRAERCHDGVAPLSDVNGSNQDQAASDASRRSTASDIPQNDTAKDNTAGGIPQNPETGNPNQNKTNGTDVPAATVAGDRSRTALEKSNEKEDVSADVLAPECGSTAVTVLNNGSRSSVAFEVSRGSAGRPEQTISLAPKAVISVTTEVVSATDILRVSRGDDVLVDVTITPHDACAPSAEQSSDTLYASFGEWGTPVRVDDFDGSELQQGKGGWQAYDSPQGSPARTKDAVRLGALEPANSSVTGELQVVGFYDKTAGRHVGGGVADTFGQQYGRWEVRARTDKGAGFAPIILLWPHGGRWPNDGEIDLLESPRGDRHKAIAVLHNGPSNKFKTHGIDGDHSQWHTYAVEWLPGRVTFFLDGVEQWNVTDKSLVPSTSPMHLVLQNDAGCGWIQCPNGDTAPETVMHVDWIKVYAASQSMLSN